jgi:sulfur-oxidizing protein SoxA
MKTIIRGTLGTLGLGLALSVSAGPVEDQAAFQKYYENKFPNTPVMDFQNGVYSILPEAREQWESIEELPPYEIAIENGEKPYGWKKGKIADVTAYMSFNSRGQKVKVEIPSDDPRALAAYEEGKEQFYTKRGQLNFACADCHMLTAGNLYRADTTSPAFGHATSWPVFRSKWQAMGTLHRRFAGCHENIRANPYKAQGTEYSNLEYFVTYMSNGLEFNGPAARK